MQKLIADLQQENMTIHSWYSRFETMGAICGGALGALIGAGREWYCSLTDKYFYYFKIKNFFSYKGIKKETIKRIALSDIERIIWKPKSFQGVFTIEHKDGKISGILSGDDDEKNNLKEMLKFIKEKCGVQIDGYFYQKEGKI